MYRREQPPRNARWAAVALAAVLVLGLFSFIPILNQLERLTVTGFRGDSARSTVRKAPEVNLPAEEASSAVIDIQLEPKDVAPVGWVRNTRVLSEKPRTAAAPVLEERQIATRIETAFVFNVEDLDYTPTPIYRKRPEYPYELKRDGVAGRVVAEFQVDSDGRTHQVRIISTDHPKFSAAVVNALMLWRFMPGMVDGKKVEFRMRIPMVFRLSNGRVDRPELQIAAVD